VIIFIYFYSDHFIKLLFLERVPQLYPFRLSYNSSEIRMKLIDNKDIKILKRFLSASPELKIKEFTLKNLKFDSLPTRVSVTIYANIANLINCYDQNEDLIDFSDKIQINFCNAKINDSALIVLYQHLMA